MRDVCAADQVADGEIKSFDLDGTGFCIARSLGRVRAFQDNCTHRRCPLVRGEVEDGVVFCPCHDAEFDLETGAVLAGPATKPLAIYATVVVDGRIRVRLPAGPEDGARG
ncbi:MAG: hypothetical protein QOH58_1815 [Thermoleophilaceae bacterium]|jgi:nitrite reductase/ring-hydroxylating ferredoxin subunit|nr:hypothetical protein [Thermoleophilaceae bacterium]